MTDVLKLYKAESYGKLFQYFFELYVIAFTMGVATDEFEKNRKNIPNMDIDKNDEVKTFLLESVSYLPEAYPPIVLEALMNRQYLECINPETTNEQKSMIELSRRLIEGIHQFSIEVILDTSRLWNDKTVDYAEKYFYPRLPSDIRKKYFL